MALHRRCWTAERRRHGLQDDDSCVMCLQASETLDHILLGCVISPEVWDRLLSRLGLMALVPHGDIDIFLWWSWARRRVPCASRKGFDSLVMLICWTHWKERNARTFRNEASSARELSLQIIQEAALWVWAGFASLLSLSSRTHFITTLSLFF